jgi:hypothetical protein
LGFVSCAFPAHHSWTQSQSQSQSQFESWKQKLVSKTASAAAAVSTALADAQTAKSPTTAATFPAAAIYKLTVSAVAITSTTAPSAVVATATA